MTIKNDDSHSDQMEYINTPYIVLDSKNTKMSKTWYFPLP